MAACAYRFGIHMRRSSKIGARTQLQIGRAIAVTSKATLLSQIGGPLVVTNRRRGLSFNKHGGGLVLTNRGTPQIGDPFVNANKGSHTCYK